MPPKPHPSRSPPPSLPPQALLHTLQSLLSLELHAETTQNALLLGAAPPPLLARAGLALLNLSITSYRTGLGGRTVLELGLDPALAPSAKDSSNNHSSGLPPLPEHGIRTGDIVRVGERPRDTAKKREVAEGKERGVEGVVVRVGERVVQVALGKEGKKGGKEEDDSAGAGLEGLPDGKLWM